MANDLIKGIILGVAILYVLGGGIGGQQQGTGGTSGGGSTITVTPTGCNYAPTVALGAEDKYDSSVDVKSGTWKYKLNGGATATDTDGSFEVKEDSTLAVLVADANSSSHYRAIWSPQLGCGLNSISYNDVVKFSSYETKCFNDEGYPMNASTYNANLTIGTGGSRTVKCELTGVADTGMPYGGVMVLEFNQTLYEEGKLDLQWDGTVQKSVTTPAQYTVHAAAYTTKSFEVPAFEDVGTHTFYLTIQAESQDDPSVGVCTSTALSSGIFGRIYPKNCFEEEDVTPSEFKCAIEDMDDTFTSPGGTTKDTADITSFLICVD